MVTSDDVRCWEPLVRRLACARARQLPLGLMGDLDDLVQEGLMAVWKALQSHDRHRQASLTSWIHLKVRGALLDAARNLDYLARSHRAAMRAGLAAPVKVISLEALDSRKPSQRIREVLSDLAGDDPAAGLLAGDLADYLCRGRSPRDREVFRRWFVLGQTMRVIGPAVGVSWSAISRLVADLASYAQERLAFLEARSARGVR